MRRLYTFLIILLAQSSIGFSQNANWSAILPALFPTNASGQIHGISRISQMKFHPTNANKMYAVSARGGLFISTNGGNNWTVTPGTDNLPYSAFASVCVDFTNDQIIYLGAGDHNYYYSWGGSTGVWKSIDGGLTFTQTTLNNKIIVDMVMDPLDHNVIVAVTNGGIYKTTNAGSTWTLKTASREFDDLKQRTPVSRMLYAATTDSAFFRSVDFGNTWTQITSGIVLPVGVTDGNGCRIAVTPADTNIVYLGMVANSGLIYKSTDAGLSFSAIKTTTPPYLTYYDNLSTSSGQGDYNFGIGVDRVDPNIIYLVAHNVWKSTNGGANWSQLTNWWAKVHTDMHQITTSPYNNNQLWDMNDGGVWLSTDGGNNWSPKSDGIFGYEIYQGNCSPTRRDMMSIGTQDNGELYATSSGWFTNRGGDWGSDCAFDYRPNSSVVYYYQNNKRRVVTAGDQTYGLPAAVTSLEDIAFNRSNVDLAFVAKSAIYRTTNLTALTPTWTGDIFSQSKTIMALHSSFADPNRLYAITNDGFIYVSSNALSAMPTFTSHALPNSTNNNATITTIKSSPNTIYVTCNTKVYRSTDNGVNWTNMTYNLPSVNHVRIIADEYFSVNELVFIATNNAVYYKIGSATSWSIFSNNLPSRTSIVNMSIYNDSTNNTTLRVATYGRGMWETPISTLRALTANFMADKTNPCPGTATQFSDLSTGNVMSRTWSFPGGTPSSSTAVNPSVVYNSAGTYTVSLTVSDGVINNSITKTDYILVTGNNIPVIEGFEGASDPPDGWSNINNANQNYEWAKTSSAGGFGLSSNSMMFDNYSWNVQGETDELRVKRVNLIGYNSVSLTFDVAYQVYTGYTDSLIVRISTDCGNSFTRIYSKGGSTLSTAGSATSNFVPSAAQWRTETVSLNSYVGQGNVVIEFQNINGYGNKLYIDNINISPAVKADAGIDKSICAGQSIGIGMSPDAGVTYSWSPGAGLSSSTVANPTASPANTTSYVLTATQTSTGYFNRDTVIVTVNQQATAGVSIAASPAGSVCQGATITYTATSSNGGTPVYQWKRNGTSVGSGTNVYSTNVLSNGDVILCVMTGNAPCVSGSPATSNSITVSINPTITASVTISANPSGAICSGTNVTFTASPVNGGVPSYQWKLNNLNVGINSSSYSNNALIQGDLINCVMTSTASCVASSQVTSNTYTTTISSAGNASVSISASPTGTVCSGTNVTFTATPVNGGMPSYQWRKNGTNVGSNSNTYSDNTLVSGMPVSCVMTSSLTCISGSPATSNSISKSINNVPVINSFSPLTGSPGTSVLISGTNFSFVSAVKFNGLAATYTVNSSVQITATVPASVTSGPITVTNSCGTGASSLSFGNVPASISLNLKVFVEGYYRGAGVMEPVSDPAVCDTVTLELHQGVSPYSLVASVKNTINTSGNGSFIFSNSLFGNSYYLVVRHRNSLETWSASPVLLNGDAVGYDFTTAANKAFGNNLKDMLDGRFAMFSGDLNQSGGIDINDMLLFETNILAWQNGYLVTDVTGDNISESADYSLIENNVGHVDVLRP